MTDEGILVFLVFEIPEWLTQTLKSALAYLFIFFLLVVSLQDPSTWNIMGLLVLISVIPLPLISN